MPTTNSGSAASPSVVTEVVWSNALSRRRALTAPSAIPSGTLITRRDEHEEERVDEPLADHLRDGQAVRERRAEVAGQDSGDPLPVLLEHRLVEPELPPELRERLGRRAPSEDRARGVTRQRLRRGEDDRRT